MARLEMRSLLVLFLSLISINTILAQKKRKPIVTSLNAKWSNTPILLEVRSISHTPRFHLFLLILSWCELQAAEFLNTESPDYFWAFVTAISEKGSLLEKTDKEQYDAIISTAAASLSKAQIDILKFSLGLRTESPKVFTYFLKTKYSEYFNTP